MAKLMYLKMKGEKNNTVTAPSAEPDETPNVKGSASGFLSKP